MLISELKELIANYKDSDSVVVALWDKECFKALDTEARIVTDREWNYVAENFSVQMHDQMLGASIREMLEKQMQSNDKATEVFIADFMEQYRTGTTEEQLWDKE